jgi:5-methylcytosine-specific restriction endonuclease McrA
MSSLERIIAAHPLRDVKPYSEIHFERCDGYGTPLYSVGGDPRPMGARKALRSAAEQFGGNCFHCGESLKPEDLTNDHLSPKADEGGDYLHNLVLACGKCNKKKGRHDLISYRPRKGREYLRALDEHLVRCIKEIGNK